MLLFVFLIRVGKAGPFRAGGGEGLYGFFQLLLSAQEIARMMLNVASF
jgi:hypothetical protein